jgi:hypothetical protein
MRGIVDILLTGTCSLAQTPEGLDSILQGGPEIIRN